MLSRQEAIAFREQTRALAMQIGLRPAARAIGLKEDRVRQWAKRYQWHIGALRPAPNGVNANPATSPNVTDPINAMASILALEADRTKLAMSRTARRAFEHTDTLKDAELHEMPRSIALEKHAKIAATAHNWTNQPVSVGVAVSVPLPSESERQEMRSMDAKLDAIAAKLKA